MITSETVAIAAATIVGPIAAVLITRWNDRRMQRRERLGQIYRTLMATRRSAISPEHVAAINLIEVEFHGIKPVIDAWTTYINHLNTGHPGEGATADQNKAFDDRRSDVRFTPKSDRKSGNYFRLTCPALVQWKIRGNGI